MSESDSAQNLTQYALGQMTAVLNVCATIIAFHPSKPTVDRAIGALAHVSQGASSRPFSDGFDEAVKHLQRTVSAVSQAQAQKRPGSTAEEAEDATNLDDLVGLLGHLQGRVALTLSVTAAMAALHQQRAVLENVMAATQSDAKEQSEQGAMQHAFAKGVDKSAQVVRAAMSGFDSGPHAH